MDYSKAKIYKLECLTTGKKYIGSTKRNLSQRLANHTYEFRQWCIDNPSHYCSSFEVIKEGNYVMMLLETYPCENKDELVTKEREYIINNDCVNKVIPKRTSKEWAIDNKEHVTELRREYREKHKERLNKCKKVYYETNKTVLNQKSKEYMENNREHLDKLSIAYRDVHKGDKKLYDIEYRKLNNDKLCADIMCESCQCTYKSHHKSSHFKTKKHILNSTQQTEPIP